MDFKILSLFLILLLLHDVFVYSSSRKKMHQHVQMKTIQEDLNEHDDSFHNTSLHLNDYFEPKHNDLWTFLNTIEIKVDLENWILYKKPMKNFGDVRALPRIEILKTIVVIFRKYEKKKLSSGCFFLFYLCPGTNREKQIDEKLMEFMMKKEKYSGTVLHRAVNDEDHESVKFLVVLFNENLKKLKKFFYIEDVKRETALHKASKKGYTKIVKLLLNSFETEKEKMKFILQSKTGSTRNALFYAVNAGHKDIVEYFLDNKFSKEFLLQTYAQENILHKTRDAEIFNLILNKLKENRNINVKLKKFLDQGSKVLKTPLQIAIKNDLPKLALEIIKANLDVDKNFSPVTIDLDRMKQFWKRHVKKEEFNSKLGGCDSVNQFFKALITTNIETYDKQ